MAAAQQIGPELLESDDGRQGEGLIGKEVDSPKISTWAEKVAIPRSQKWKMQLIFHQPDVLEDMILVLPPQEVVEEGAREWG